MKFFVETLDAARLRGHATVGNGPLSFVEPRGRFSLALPGFWHSLPLQDFPAAAHFAEMQRQLLVSILVRDVPANTEVRRAAKEGEARFASLKGWNAWKEERGAQGPFFREKTSYLRASHDALGDGASTAAEIAHAVIGDAHLTLIVRGDPEGAALLQQGIEELMRGLSTGGIGGAVGLPQPGLGQGFAPAGFPAPTQGGFPPPAQGGGFTPAGFPAPNAAQGGFPAAPTQGGFPPAQGGGFTPAGFPAPSAPAPAQGGFAPTAPQGGGFAPAGFPPAPATPAPTQGGFAPEGFPPAPHASPAQGGFAPTAPQGGGFAPAGFPPPAAAPAPSGISAPAAPVAPSAPTPAQGGAAAALGGLWGALSGRGAAPAGPPAPAPVSHAAPAATASGEADALLSFPPLAAWCSIPGEWQLGEQTRELAVLSSASEPGGLLLHAGFYPDLSGLQGTIARLFSERGYQLAPSEELRQDGALLVGAYSGKDAQGNALAARLRAARSAHGVVLLGLAVAAPQQLGKLHDDLDAVLRGARFGRISPDRRAMGELVGAWSAAGQGQARTSYRFAQDGTFQQQGGAAAAGGFGAVMGILGGQGGQAESGYFFVSHGALVLSSARGSRVLSLRREPNGLLLKGELFTRA